MPSVGVHPDATCLSPEHSEDTSQVYAVLAVRILYGLPAIALHELLERHA